MSDQQLNMNEQWDDLPVPDGEASWQKMELLLDKDKKRRRVIPFWLRYVAFGLLLGAMAVGGWLWFGQDDDKITSTHQVNKEEKKKATPFNSEKENSSISDESTTTDQTSTENKLTPKEKSPATTEGFKQSDVVSLQQNSSTKQSELSGNNSRVKTKAGQTTTALVPTKTKDVSNVPGVESGVIKA